jgi:hypothetical protein
LHFKTEAWTFTLTSQSPTKTMPRPKRPLSEADPNANNNAQPNAKNPKRIHASASRPAKPAPPEKAKPNLPKKHPNISVSIAERFSSDDSLGWRLLSTYPDPRVKELKELLSERALPKTGRKDALVARLEEYDDQHPSTERKLVMTTKTRCVDSRCQSVP